MCDDSGALHPCRAPSCNVMLKPGLGLWLDTEQLVGQVVGRLRCAGGDFTLAGRGAGGCPAALRAAGLTPPRDGGLHHRRRAQQHPQRVQQQRLVRRDARLQLCALGFLGASHSVLDSECSTCMAPAHGALHPDIAAAETQQDPRIQKRLCTCVNAYMQPGEVVAAGGPPLPRHALARRPAAGKSQGVDSRTRW